MSDIYSPDPMAVLNAKFGALDGDRARRNHDIAGWRECSKTPTYGTSCPDNLSDTVFPYRPISCDATRT